MVASSLGSVVVPAPCSWPRQWSEQEPRLERQHERLEALLAALIGLHRQPLAAELMAEGFCVCFLFELQRPAEEFVYVGRTIRSTTIASSVH